MTSQRFQLRSERVATSRGLCPAVVMVEEERIVAIEDVPSSRGEVIDLGSAALLPGLVDAHVHVNEPGRSHWEGFHTASRAAAAGGITTIVDMPLNSSPVTTSVAALEAKVRAAEGTSLVDFALWGGLVSGGAKDVGSLLDAGAVGIKCFLCPSGLDEFPAVGPADLRRALPQIGRRSSVLLAHAEDPAILDAAGAHDRGDPRSYAAYLATRPPDAEVRAIETLLQAAEESRACVHIVHVASQKALEVLAAAKRRGARVTAETCPHYLTFAAEEIPDGATAFKCAPPIREARHREALWTALEEGVLDLLATDHSPCPPEMKLQKRGDFLEAWGGIASLQLLLPAIWTGARSRGIGLDRLPEWLSRAPARLAGLGHRKGALEVGYDADIVAFDPDRSFIVRGSELEHRHPLTPFDGRRLHGAVERTYLRGELVYHRGEFPGTPRGRWLRRPERGNLR